jgi:hypothetical protein
MHFNFDKPVDPPAREATLPATNDRTQDMRHICAA